MSIWIQKTRQFLKQSPRTKFMNQDERPKMTSTRK